MEQDQSKRKVSSLALLKKARYKPGAMLKTENPGSSGTYEVRNAGDAQ